MISKTYQILSPHNPSFSFSVPETAAEYDQLAKQEGACVESAVANYMYRGVFAEIRALFTEALGAKLGIERKTKETGKTRTIKEEGKPDVTEAIVIWAETEVEFVSRALAESNTTIAAHQQLLNDIVSKLSFDPSKPESAPSGPKKVAKKWLDAAQEVINAGAADKVAAKLTEKLGMPVDASLESLGRAIAEDQRRKSVAAEYV